MKNMVADLKTAVVALLVLLGGASAVLADNEKEALIAQVYEAYGGDVLTSAQVIVLNDHKKNTVARAECKPGNAGFFSRKRKIDHRF